MKWACKLARVVQSVELACPCDSGICTEIGQAVGQLICDSSRFEKGADDGFGCPLSGAEVLEEGRDGARDDGTFIGREMRMGSGY